MSERNTTRQRAALGDASNRANGSPVKVTGQKRARPGATKSMAVENTNAGKPTASSSKKRKVETSLEEDIAAYKQDLNHIVPPSSFEDMPLPSCSFVRGRINKLVDSGIMAKTEFSKAIGCRGPSILSSFLSKTGPMGGCGSTVWYNAWAWFKQREVAKLKMPDMKKKQKLAAGAGAEAEAAAALASLSRPPKSGSTSGSGAATASLPDISHIHLGGEETDSVGVWDTCDEIRKKIDAHLTRPGLTQAQFCRDLYAQLRAPKCKSIQSGQLAKFRRSEGPRGGTKSSVFYAAYVYFEKLRCAEGMPKSSHRLAMEEIYAWNGGFDIENDNRTEYIVSAGDTPRMDKYGRIITETFAGDFY